MPFHMDVGGGASSWKGLRAIPPLRENFGFESLNLVAYSQF